MLQLPREDLLHLSVVVALCQHIVRRREYKPCAERAGKLMSNANDGQTVIETGLVSGIHNEEGVVSFMAPQNALAVVCSVQWGPLREALRD